MGEIVKTRDGQEVELLEGQILRNGRVVTLTSAVHHNRNSPCLIHIHTHRHPETKVHIPVRVTVLPVDHMYLPRRDVFPFDMWVDFGILPLRDKQDISDAFNPPMSQWFSRENFNDIFHSWIEKCGLGASAIGVERKFLPMFCTTQQFQLAKFVVWPKGSLDIWSTAPHRVLEGIIAYENDRSWARGVNPIFTKNTVSQFASKMGFPPQGPKHGPLELDRYARAYNALLLKTWSAI
jgi:hypothetical protein